MKAYGEFRLDTRQAVDIAKAYLHDLFEEDGLLNLRLEEVERDDRRWRMTFGFNRPMVEAILAEEMLGGDAGSTLGPRAYRVVTVRDDDGEVESVKIREGLF